MTQKFTIIMAVTINSILLAALFFTTLNEQKQHTEIVEEKALDATLISELELDDDKKISQALEGTPAVSSSLETTQITHTLPKQQYSAPPNWHYVTIKRGDTLQKLANKHNTTIKNIMKKNDLNSTFVKIDQRILVPSSHDFYIVQAGDNPWLIAMKHHINVNDLLRINNLNKKTARSLRPGDKLRIR